MISIKSKTELEKLAVAGRLSANALMYGGSMIKAGMTTYELDKLIHDYIVKNGGTPTFLGYGGFKGSACISLNEKVIHGIPSKHEVIKDGDIVTIDTGATVDGWCGDNAYTFPVGKVNEETLKLLEVTKEALRIGIAQAVPGNRVGDISHAIEEYVRSFGYGIVKEYCGHGVGRTLHESPEVPNYGTAGKGPRLMPGMVIAIEPMISLKGDAIRQLPDGWGVVSKSGAPTAHYENTIAITKDGPEIFTKATI